MKKRIEIRQKYQRTAINFSKKITSFGSPVLSVILKSPITAKETLFSRKFLLDTGASISIINATYEKFLAELEQIDTLNVKYGGGKSKKLPVYKVIFIVKGKELESTVAYDDKLPFLLLGQYDFFENFSYNLFDSILKESRLIKT